MSTPEDAPWQKIATRKQQDRASKIPRRWHIRSDALPKDPPHPEDGPQPVTDIPRQYLSRSEVAITETYSIASLLTALSTRRLSAKEVATAFCHRAAIAHQLTNCLTEVLFDSCITRAKELDRYLSKHGQPIGPLHGLPVSVKDTFNIKGVDSSIGIASLCYKPATSNAPLVDLLLSLGCVIIAKTNIPQTLSSLDSVNNVFGRTYNPLNRLLSGGGSSGGEGVLTAMKGNMIGWGTDIGGSIRIPAAHNGVYGFKPSEGCLPYGGQQGMGAEGGGRASVKAVAGPIARSIQDIHTVMGEVVPRAHLWGEDCLSATWSRALTTRRAHGSGPNGEFVIGILRSDGNCALLPPIAKLMDEVSTTLRRTPNVKVIDLPTPRAWTRSQSTMSKLMFVEGNGHARSLLDATQEPLVPWLTNRYPSGDPQPFSRLAQLQAQRAELQTEMLALWAQVDAQGRRTRRIDAIVCPLAAHPVPEIEKYNAVGYTSGWVLFDYPAGTVPVREFAESDLELGKKFNGKMLGSWDEKNRELWDEEKTDRRNYLKGVLSVQVVTGRREDEALCEAMRVVDEAVGMRKKGDQNAEGVGWMAKL